MGEDIIDMDLNMEGGRKEEKEQDGTIGNQKAQQEGSKGLEEAGEQHPEEDEPRLVLEHPGEENGRTVPFNIWMECIRNGFWIMLHM